jgi:hypothetical protein
MHEYVVLIDLGLYKETLPPDKCAEGLAKSWDSLVYKKQNEGNYYVKTPDLIPDGQRKALESRHVVVVQLF